MNGEYGQQERDCRQADRFGDQIDPQLPGAASEYFLRIDTAHARRSLCDREINEVDNRDQQDQQGNRQQRLGGVAVSPFLGDRFVEEIEVVQSDEP